MPLTKKGQKVMRAMKKSYGAAKGKQVFYASENAGKLAGVHQAKARRSGGLLSPKR